MGKPPFGRSVTFSTGHGVDPGAISSVKWRMIMATTIDASWIAKAGADANARPDTKWKICKAVDGIARCTEKPVRIETGGRPPQGAVPVKNIGRDDDHRSRLDRNAGKFIGSERNTANGGDGRIEPVGFIDHRTCFNEAIGQTLQLPIELAVSFGLDPLPPLL